MKCYLNDSDVIFSAERPLLRLVVNWAAMEFCSEVGAMNSESIKSGLTAGFAASAALAIAITLKTRAGFAPEFNPVADIAMLADKATGLRLPPDLGWVGHFLIGTVGWGLIYALLQPALPGGPLRKGLLFGLAVWLATMLVFMPFTGPGISNLTADLLALAFSLLFGGVLGAVYANVSGAAAVEDVRPQ
jgi:hypothetical protein